MQSRFFSLALSSALAASTVAAPAAAFAQTTPPSTAGGAASSQQSPQQQPAQPQPAQQAQPMQPSTQQQPGGQSSSQSSSSSGQSGEKLPPPPVPPVLPAVPDVAPGYMAPKNAPLPSGDLVGVNQGPFVGIQLQDAIAMALQRNTDLAIAQANVRIANFQIVAAKGQFDVGFEIQPQYSHQVEPLISVLQPGPNNGPVTQDTAGATAGFTGQLESGQHYSLTATGTSVNNNQIYNSFTQYYQTALALNITQSLGRGSGLSSAKRQLLIARTQSAQQTATLLTQASQTITNVSTTYWNLVYAWRNVGIQEEGLREAQAQAQSNSRLAARGNVAPVDIVESNTQVNVFQDNIFAALAQVQQLQVQLKQEILSNPADPVWFANLVPTSPVQALPPEPKLQDLIVTALQNRPEIAQLRAQRDAANIDIAYSKDQLKPQVDLNLNITNNGFAGFPSSQLQTTPLFSVLGNEITAVNTLLGLAGNPLPQIPNSLAANPPAYEDGGLGEAWKTALQGRFPSYSINVTFTYPFGNRTAKANLEVAREEARQIGVQELALLERVRGEAINAIQQFRETQYRLVAASAARAASERVLRAEQRRFSVGASTTFLVLQRQLEVANNRGRELQAQTDLNNAVVELNRVSGNVFANNNVVVGGTGLGTLGTVRPTQSNLPPPAK